MQDNLIDHKSELKNKSVFLPVKIAVIQANCVNPDENSVAFHLGLHCLSN